MKLTKAMGEHTKQITFMLEGDRVYILVDKYDHDAWVVVLPGDGMDVTGMLTSAQRVKVERKIAKHFQEVTRA